MLLCECLHEDIVHCGGNCVVVLSDSQKICNSICVLKNETSCGENANIARYILETKQDLIKLDGSVRSGLFAINNKCPKKLSVLLKDDSFDSTMAIARQTNKTKIIGYVELPVNEVKKIADLNVIIDNYGYFAKNSFDFPNHCSISSFSGLSLKDLQKELKIQVDLSKISKKVIKV
ncbi:MAG: hypothetical protein LBU09_01845 [Endomicrobium sp.]|jgi:hypothetical protein|nr:hypothetical protein [Endomicrobium sp.]